MSVSSHKWKIKEVNFVSLRYLERYYTTNNRICATILDFSLESSAGLEHINL